MPEISISDETYRALKDRAEPFEDTPDTVIRRLLTQQSRAEEKGDASEAAARDVAESDSTVALQNLHGKRAEPGEFTPPDEFKDKIVAVLQEAGGELPTKEAIDQVGDRMEGRFKPMDLAKIPSGEVRWRNNTRWARQELVKEGMIDSDAPHGVWRLTKESE